MLCAWTGCSENTHNRITLFSVNETLNNTNLVWDDKDEIGQNSMKSIWESILFTQVCTIRSN
jgi:hypothetical protein